MWSFAIKLFDGLKEILAGDKPVLRKLRILRYVACIIMLFIGFCSSYWNLLSYIDFPCVPLLEEKYRLAIHSVGKIFVVAWIIYSALFHNIYRLVCKDYWIQISYIDILIDFIFTIYFVTYSLNIGIEFANGLEVHIKMELMIAIIYLIYCGLSKSYNLYTIKYEQGTEPEYTGYCDNEGKEIMVNAEVFYKGKKCKIVKHEKIYRLLPYDEKIITKDLIKLEDAAGGMDGKLFVKK